MPDQRFSNRERLRRLGVRRAGGIRGGTQHRTHRHSHRVALLFVMGVASVSGCGDRTSVPAADPAFASLITRLSEPAGYFDTDNLISNERSYLHVLGGMRERGVSGGAYIGVGPDQNFSYMAQVRPSIAFIVDIRRDNMLQHLMFKGMFALARNRVAYLCLLFGRPPPSDLASWDDAEVGRLISYIDDKPASTAPRARRAVDSVVERFGVALDDADRATIARFHQEFIDAGLSLRFHSTGRAPRGYYPTYRDLMLERDRSGRQANYLVSDADFQFLKTMQAADRVIPVVGDLAGNRSLREIGRYLGEIGQHVTALYTSNVEFYLFRDRSFDAFVTNVATLPHDERSVIIRSVFMATFGPHPLAVPGYASTQTLQPIDRLLRDQDSGLNTTYWAVVTSSALP
ncbi:MAG TPA: hypothetical protein VGA37_06205 [Gemmatimonadales bacterium]